MAKDRFYGMRPAFSHQRLSFTEEGKVQAIPSEGWDITLDWTKRLFKHLCLRLNQKEKERMKNLIVVLAIVTSERALPLWLRPGGGDSSISSTNREIAGADESIASWESPHEVRPGPSRDPPADEMDFELDERRETGEWGVSTVPVVTASARTRCGA